MGTVRNARLPVPIELARYSGPPLSFRAHGEALPLRLSAVRTRTILFRASKRGVVYERARRLLRPLASDLKAWRKASGNPADDALVIPDRGGEPWADHDWDNWRDRTFRPAARAAGLPASDEDGANRVRPRDLRSSFATPLIYEGQPPQYVASQLGNSPATLMRDYARLWEDFDPGQRISAEDHIARARRRVRSSRR
jgi:integrase